MMYEPVVTVGIAENLTNVTIAVMIRPRADVIIRHPVNRPCYVSE